jgi:hypothetical protein
LWSLILGTLALDLINGKTEDHLKELLKPYLSYLAKVGIAPGRLDLLIWAIVLTLGWFIVERIIRPWCERLGEKLERYSVSHLASDVLDLAFRTRIYRVAIDAGYRAALKRAASCLPEVEKSRVEEIKTSSGFEKSFKRDHVQFWLGSAPDIATISSLGTIPEIVERVHSGELDVITAVDEGPEGAMRLRNRFERSEPLRG